VLKKEKKLKPSREEKGKNYIGVIERKEEPSVGDRDWRNKEKSLRTGSGGGGFLGGWFVLADSLKNEGVAGWASSLSFFRGKILG